MEIWIYLAAFVAMMGGAFCYYRGEAKRQDRWWER